MDELDLYAHNTDWNWKRSVAVAAVFFLLAGAVGYRWMTTVTPVSRQSAIEMFNEQKDGSKSERRPTRKTADSSKKDRRNEGSKPDAPVVAGGSSEDGQAEDRATSASGGARSDRDRSREGERSESNSETSRRLLREGVYSWDTEGFESAGGARRSFPRESQRIVTHDGDSGWSQHHYFSEQREIWSRFVIDDGAAHMASQRNKVVFGPVTEDSTITFSPPMLVGPAPEKVGEAWQGTWKGATYGDYQGRVFEHGQMNVGGESVEVWGIDLDIHLRGETQGRVQAKVWLSPEYAMTVREDYVQDIKADVGNYHAEWSMTLKSLQPAR